MTVETLYWKKGGNVMNMWLKRKKGNKVTDLEDTGRIYYIIVVECSQKNRGCH